MKARKLSRRSRNRSAIAKKGWETRRHRQAEAGNMMYADLIGVGRPPKPFEPAPFHVPPDMVWPEPLKATAYEDVGIGIAPNPAPDEDTAELDASNLTLRGGAADPDPDWRTFPPTLGPRVTMLKIDGSSEELRLAPADPATVKIAKEVGVPVGTIKTDRSDVVRQMRIDRGQFVLPAREREEDLRAGFHLGGSESECNTGAESSTELEAYKERIEKERAQERLQSQEAHAAALRATVERVLVQGFMGDMRGNADFKTQASHWLMNMDQAEAVFAALQRAGY